MERLKKIAVVLNSYTETDKMNKRWEYQLLESYANQVADGVMKDLGILDRRPNL